MAVDTAAKRKSVVDYALPGPAIPMGATAGVVVGERAHLTALYSGFGYTVTVTTKALVVNAVDEQGTGVATTIYAQFKNQDGTSIAFDSTPTIRIWSVNSATGADVVEVAETNMTLLGSNTYSYAWTPSADGAYSIAVEGTYGGTAQITSANVTARPKFDPIALALSDILVARN